MLGLPVGTSLEAIMGSASVQGPLWGARAEDWAELAEPVQVTFFDGATACALLTDNARQDAETFGRSCAAGLATLPDPGAVQQVEVWGDSAQVHLAGVTVFLLSIYLRQRGSPESKPVGVPHSATGVGG
jgi:hypothetical protein